MTQLNIAAVLRSVQSQEPGALSAVLEGLGRELGGSDVVLYLVDFGQTVLEPMGDYSTHDELPRPEEVASTMAGRAFVTQQSVSAQRGEAFRLWAPVREGSDQTGVLAVTVPDVGPGTVQVFEDLALFSGYMITSLARVSDVFNLHRRRKAMTLAASMQWDLLPPLVCSSSSVSLAAFLEPAYEVGGDCFDYALNGPLLDLAIMDSMGHGLGSAMLAGLALGCYRHGRRHGRSLETMHHDVGTTVEDCTTGEGEGFVTGQLAQLNITTGRLRWTNAGHPLPLHIRGGRVIGQLDCLATLPWGLGDPSVSPEVAEQDLEPRDRVLFFTDGVVDSKTTFGSSFDLDRLIDLAGQTASDQLSPEQVVRRLVRAVLEDHGKLVDDATLLMVEWLGPTRS